MRLGPVKAVMLGSGLLAGYCGVSGSTAPASPTADAIGLYRQGRYGEARAALETLVAADPSNAAACYFLSMTLQRASPPLMDSARTWLSKAVRLAPENEVYLAEYAGVTMLLADRDNSLGLALDGRDAMARAIAMNPSDLDAREGLMRFCAKAPWPLGDADKAMDLAAGIALRDPRRGAAAYRTIASLFGRQGRAQQALSASQAAQRLAPAKQK
jgi:tetratricopeptide (TPR) repeat protein